MNNTPILPDSKIKKCLIGKKYTDEINDLQELGIECIGINPLNTLDSEINSHADILCFNPGNGYIIAEDMTAGELRNLLSGYTVINCKNIKSPYPYDVKLNVALINNNLICNSNYVADEIKAYCEENKINIIHSKQGYVKCSLCVVTENSVITEDDGLAYLLKKCQFDVLHIRPGFVKLSAKHHGFIGGASGKISKNQIYFSGDLSSHPDYIKIKVFLNAYNIEPVYNNNRPLNDFGGFIQL